MPKCPVCQTRYATNKTERCPLCGWDVQPLSFVTGMIPEVAQKEAVRLEWAKQLWSKAKLKQDQARQFQLQAQEASDREQVFQAQLEKSAQEARELAERLRQAEATIEGLQAQFSQSSESIHAPDIEFPPLEAIAPPPHLEVVEPAIIEDIKPFIDSPFQKIEVSKEVSLVVPSVQVIDTSELQRFTFEVVLIQAQGHEIHQQEANYFKQPLDKDIHLEMVLIPAGQFWMGSPDTEPGRDSHESPQRLVTVAPFFMSRFPITQAQWKAIAALPKIKRSLNLYPADFEGEDHPVEQVSWYDTIEFCARLSQKAGRTYRLPSEAEWEYACRAGTQTPFHFGDTIAPDLANYDGNYTYSFGISGAYRQSTTPVWAFPVANNFGLSNLHGNVWEWCADEWHENYENAPNDERAWISEDSATYRVLRGGAWYCLPELCRSAQRHWNQPDMTGSGIGFRVVCAA